MNEVLTQIAKQAMVEHCISHVRLQEFAKLIVNQCINALDEADGGVHHSQCLLEHFGVEE